MGVWEWGRKRFLGELVGRCQLHAPGLPQASWLTATPAPGETSFFFAGEGTVEVWEHSLALHPHSGQAEAAPRVTVGTPVEAARSDSQQCCWQHCAEDQISAF